MLIARTDPDRSKGHRGLSILIVPKERADGEGFKLTQPEGARSRGGPIDTSATGACTPTSWPSTTTWSRPRT